MVLQSKHHLRSYKVNNLSVKSLNKNLSTLHYRDRLRIPLATANLGQDFAASVVLGRP